MGQSSLKENFVGSKRSIHDEPYFQMQHHDIKELKSLIHVQHKVFNYSII